MMKHWDVVCKRCNRMLIDGEWTDEGLPTRRVTSTVCPDCLAQESNQQAKPDSKDDPDGGMIFQQQKRSKKKKKWLW